MGFVSVNAIFFFVWLIGGGGEGFGMFITIMWTIAIGGFILFKWIDRKTSYTELSIENSDEGRKKATDLFNKLHWTPTGSMQTSIRKYIAFRMHAQNIDDFDWLVKYIDAFGDYPNGDIDNPYAEKVIIIGGNIYKCKSINLDYTVSEIYRITYTKEEQDLVENLRFGKIEPKAKTLTEAMYINMKTNTLENTFENAIINLKRLKEENPQFFKDTPKSSKLNKTGIVEDINEIEETSEYQTSDEEKQKAIRILQQQNWEKLNNTPDNRLQYCSRKQFSPNPDEFKWVVEYLSGRGTPENPKSPHSYVITKLNGIEYKSIKVNKYFEGTVIYKIGEIAEVKDEMQVLEPTEKLRLSMKKIKLETRFKNHPVAQQNMQLINERKIELKQKKEEYLKLRNRNEDEVFISLYSSGLINIEEYEQQLEDLKDKIEDLKDEIEELKYEIDEIREEIEDEIEDEEWEREMNNW